MNLDDFKSAWDTFSELDDLQQETNRMKTLQLIEQNASTRLKQQNNRYKRMSLWFLTLPILIFILFYTMSDGFTDPQDSPGALMVSLVLVLPFLTFFGARYFSTQRVSDSKDVAVRNYLPKVVETLKSNQKAELVVLIIVTLLTLIGLLLTVIFNTAVPFWVMGGAMLLIIGLGFKGWRAYEAQKNEINGYIEQLNEMM